MKKNYKIGLLMLNFVLCGCSGVSSQTRGVVDCYSITVKSGQITLLSKTYYYGTTAVYQYSDSKGKSIYMDTEHKNYVESSSGGEYTYENIQIHLYEDSYTEEYSVYNFVSFVGWLTYETNYYLDIDNRIVDIESKWSEYAHDNVLADRIEADNKKAYACAKKNYYQGFYSSSYSRDENGKYYLPIKADKVDKTLEKHSYMMLGENSVVSYEPKWF